MKTTKLHETIEQLISQSEYIKAAETFAKETDLKLIIHGYEYKSADWDEEGVQRFVFDLELERGLDNYRFEFGQSIAKGNEEPTMYDILSTIEKYDPESFENFCDNNGYDQGSRKTERIYNAVQNEYDNISIMFNEEELEVLKSIS